MQINNLSYEDAVIKLENILEELEVDECTLAESLEKYKNGILLYRHCNQILTGVEGEVKVLLANEKEILEEIDFLREVEDEY